MTPSMCIPIDAQHSFPFALSFQSEAPLDRPFFRRRSRFSSPQQLRTLLHRKEVFLLVCGLGYAPPALGCCDPLENDLSLGLGKIQIFMLAFFPPSAHELPEAEKTLSGDGGRHYGSRPFSPFWLPNVRVSFLL